MKTLDKKRDFGTITGDEQGRMYEQDNCYFTADGSEWQDPAQPRREVKTAKVDKVVKTDPPGPGDDQLNAQLNG